MVKIIECKKWGFNPQTITTGFQKNTGQRLTTEGIIENLQNLSKNKNMQELNEQILQSNQYFSSKKDA